MTQPENIYCMDTSGWLDGWARHYPPEVFPSLWARLEEMIAGGRIKSSEEVYIEIDSKDDALHDWIKARKKELLIPLDTEVQSIASEILSQFPRLVDTLKGRSQADPFVVATAEYLGAVVVSGERPNNNLAKPRIPEPGCLQCPAAGALHFIPRHAQGAGLDVLISATDMKQIPIVNNLNEHEAALARLEELILMDPDADSPEEHELANLAKAIQAFEKRTFLQD